MHQGASFGIVSSHPLKKHDFSASIFMCLWDVISKSIIEYIHRRHMFFMFFPTTFMLRVTFSPAPECVVADCWNRVFPTPRATRPPLLLLLLLLFYTRLNKRLSRECVYWKAIITTQRYLGPFNVLQKRQRTDF